MISTRNIAALPDIITLRRIMQSLAMLDAVLEEEWEYRYYSFDTKWSDTEQMGSMRNGSGDDLFALFDDSGCFLRGFDHESIMSPWNSGNPGGIWPGVLDQVPPQFTNSLNEPAFHMEDTTFCIWRGANDKSWSCGKIDFPDAKDPDGSEWMMELLDGNPQSYQGFAKEYYEIDVPLHAIKRIFFHETLSPELFRKFPTSRKYKDVVKDARDIGYPIQ